MKAFSVSRRGRPSQGRRDAKTHRAAPDAGSPDLLAKRLALVAGMPLGDALAEVLKAGGRIPAGYDIEASLSEYALGVCLARQFISVEQHNDGVTYARVYHLAVGRPHPSVERIWHAIVSGFTDMGFDAIEKTPASGMKGKLIDIQASVRGAVGMRGLRVLHNVAVESRLPKFVETGRNHPDRFWLAAWRDLDLLRGALDSIREGYSRRRH